MVDSTLAFNLLAKDNASRAINKVGKSAEDTGRKFGFLAARSHGLTAGMTAGFGKIAVGLGAIAGVQAFTGFINDARESAKIGRLTENVIRSTGKAAHVSADQVGDLATAISNKTGADDEAIQSGQNLLLTFTGIRNEVGKGNDIFNQASQTIVDMTAALNNGEVSTEGLKASSIQLGKALNDPVKGVTALQKVGVSFTEQQKKQIKTLVDSGKTLEAQKIILGELKKEFGGAAAAAADPLTKLKTIAGNLSEQVGGFLLPTVDRFATFLGDKAIPAVSSFASAFADKVGPKLKEFGGFVRDNVIPAVTGLASTIGSRLAKIDLSGIASSFKAQAMKWGGALIDGVKDGLAFGDWRPLGKTLGDGLVKAFQALAQGANKLGDAIGGLIDKVDWGALGTKISSGLHDMFGSVNWVAVGDTIGDAVVTIVRTSSTLVQKLGMAFRDVIGRVDWRQVGHDMTSAIIGVLEGVDWGTVGKTILKSAVVGLPNLFADIMNAISKGVFGLIGGIIKAISDEIEKGRLKLVAKTKELGGWLIFGLKDGVVSAMRGIGGWLKSTIVDPIVGAAKAFFGIHSPSTVFAAIGSQLIAGLKSGIVGAATGIGAWVWRVVIHPLIAPFASAGTWLIQEGRNVISGFLSGLSSRWEDVKKWVGGIATWIKDHKGPVSLDARLLIPAGRAIMGGFLKGLQSGAGRAWDFVKSVGGKTVAQLRDTLSFVAGGFTGGTGSNIDIGRAMAARAGWTGDQWKALFSLWTRESGWNNLADNPTSTAFGIPQFLNSTAAAYGVLGDTDPRHQIAAGMQYIRDVYGNPLNAWRAWNSRSPHWYEQGTPWVPNDQIAYLHKGEAVIPADVNRRALVGAAAPQAVAPVELGPRTVDALARAYAKAIGGAKLRVETRGGQTYATLLPSGG